MFKDYYKILNIPQNATKDEIRVAYRNLCKQFHPDINSDADATAKMQDINEAYELLKDPLKRQRYDEEYARFTTYKQTANNATSSSQDAHQTSQSSNGRKSYTYESYDIQDEYVKRDVDEARKKAEDYINELISSMGESAKKAAKGAWDGVWPYLLLGLIGIIISFLMFNAY